MSVHTAALPSINWWCRITGVPNRLLSGTLPALAAVFKWKEDPALHSLAEEDIGNTMVHSTDEQMEH